MCRFIVIDFSFMNSQSLHEFYKLIMSPKFMKIVGGDPSTIWMLRKIGNLLLDTFQ